MLWPQALDLQALSQLVEATVQIPTKLHQVLDVEDVGEVDLLTPQAVIIFVQASQPEKAETLAPDAIPVALERVSTPDNCIV